jgi:ADP-heptose:LPS heptosyltransferase
LLRNIADRFQGLLFSLLTFLFRKTQVSPPLVDSVKRILVIRQHNQLGDMLCMVPLLRELRSKYPKSWIALMASPVNADVMFHHRLLDEVIIFDKRQMLGRVGLKIGELLRFIRNVRSKRFDVVLVPSTVSLSSTSTLLAFLSGARVRIGAQKLEGVVHTLAFLFNLPVELDWQSDRHRHQSLRNLDIARPLGLSVSDLSIEMGLRAEELGMGRKFITEAIANVGWGETDRPVQEHRPKVALHPGAGKPPNQWPAKCFSRVADSLAEEFQVDLFISEGPMDSQPVSEMRLLLKHKATLITGLPIREVAAILKQMDLVISNDTGIMHVAAAVGVPVLSLFGPTDPLQWAPIGDKHRFIQAKDGNMGSISVEEVLVNAREMLGP